MFCPQCGSTQLDDLRFCKACGANLHAVRNVMTTRDAEEKFDWSKTWVAEMFMSHRELDRLKGNTPEVKRRNEIKGGVITASVGLGLMIVLYMLMEAIVMNPRIPPETVILLRSIWIVGVLPLLVGLALIINGVFVSKVPTESNDHPTEDRPKASGRSSDVSFLPPKTETNPLEREVFSVTDETTRHLDEPLKVKR